VGPLPRRAASCEPAEVLRGSAANAHRQLGGQRQRRHHHGDGGRGAGDSRARQGGGRHRVEPRAASAEPRAASALPGRARKRLRPGVDADRDGHRGRGRRRHVRHARQADPDARRPRAGLRGGARSRLQQLGVGLLPEAAGPAEVCRAGGDAQPPGGDRRGAPVRSRAGRRRDHRHATRRAIRSGARWKSWTCRSAFTRPAIPR